MMVDSQKAAHCSSMQAYVTPIAPSGNLSVHDITLQLGGRMMVKHFNQDFSPGQMWCVMGPNGAGKTTLIHMLAGLSTPQKGQVCLDGRALSDWPLIELARRRAWMPQILQDAFALSVMESVLLARHPYREMFRIGKQKGVRKEEADLEKVQALLNALEIEVLAKRSVCSLSGGERQRVALAAALCQDTGLLLLDEPLAHVDVPHQLTCLRVLRARCNPKEGGAACVIFSGHDFYIAGLFATHVLLLDGLGGAFAGTVQEVLTPEYVSHAFGHPFKWVPEGVNRQGERFLMPIL